MTSPHARTVGVEEEFLLVGPDGAPRPVADRMIAGSAAQVEHELYQEQAEIDTPPRTGLDQLLADLCERRAQLAAAAPRHGAEAVALGTSPVAATPTPTPDPRYRRLIAEYGAVAEEELTCGCHVHVGIGSRAEGVRVIDAVQPWLAVLVALCANSPFWQGQDTGYASYRREVWGRWPGAGPTERFGSVEAYEATVGSLLRAGVLLDEAMVYFDVRLSATYPTVEFRVADVCPEPEDAVLLAALCRALVDSALVDPAADGDERAPVALLRGASWRAARSGLSGDLVDPVAGVAVPAPALLERLVDRVRPALVRSGDLDDVESGIARILRRGTGADLQRATFDRTRDLGQVALAATVRSG
jgi:carboxylate-amine ligase